MVKAGRVERRLLVVFVVLLMLGNVVMEASGADRAEAQRQGSIDRKAGRIHKNTWRPRQSRMLLQRLSLGRNDGEESVLDDDTSELDNALDGYSEKHDDEEPYEDSLLGDDRDAFGFEDAFGSLDLDIDSKLENAFPQIDSDCSGDLSLHELTQWHSAINTNASRKRAQRELSLIDLDKDGTLSLNEFVAGNAFHLSVDQDEQPSTTDPKTLERQYGSSDWMNGIIKQFHIVDRNRDGKLTLDEFLDFLHPEETEQRELMDHLTKDDIRKRDQDGDERISWTEFSESLWFDLIDFDNLPSRLTIGHDGDQFAFPGDGYIDEHEMRAVTPRLHMREHDFAHVEAGHLLAEADENGNGRLTLEEMKNNRGIFYGTALGVPNYYEDDISELDELDKSGWLWNEV